LQGKSQKIFRFQRCDAGRCPPNAWIRATLYQEAIYEAALPKHGSPLVALFDCIELGKSPFKKPMKKS